MEFLKILEIKVSKTAKYYFTITEKIKNLM